MWEIGISAVFVAAREVKDEHTRVVASMVVDNLVSPVDAARDLMNSSFAEE